MPNEEVKNVEVTDAPQLEETPVKKPRKPREKIRAIEDIIDLPVKKLSEKEKDALIEHLKEAHMTSEAQAQLYKQNARSAYEKINQTNDEFKAMEQYYKKQLSYIAVQLAAFQSAVEQATKGGVM